LILPTLQHFFFHLHLKTKNPVGQNSDFRRYVAACVHVPDNTRLIATYAEEYSLADVSLSYDSLTCLPRPIQCRQQTIIFLLPSETSETQLEVRTSRYILRLKKKVKRPTYPIFFGYVTLITHIFLFGLMEKHN
jgi:hypothetical protein